MNSIFNQIETNNDISTILQLTKDASEYYICSTEILDINKFYTLTGKISYHEKITDVIFTGSYEENIIYYVQRYNERFFKVLDVYDCKEDKYEKYLTNNTKFLTNSLTSFINMLPGNTQIDYKLYKVRLIFDEVIDINILITIAKKYSLDINVYVSLFELLISNLKKDNYNFLSLYSYSEYLSCIHPAYLIHIRDKLFDIYYYNYIKTFSLKYFCEAIYYTKPNDEILKKYIKDLETFDDLIYCLKNMLYYQQLYRASFIEKIKFFKPSLSDIKMICKRFDNFTYEDFELTTWDKLKLKFI